MNNCYANYGATNARELAAILAGDLSTPPDPRVREPYRLTPQLALRVGVLGVVALLVRRPLLPALVAAGALRRRVPERGPEQPAAAGPRRGAARAAARPPRPGRRVERRRDGGGALGRRPAEGGPLRARAAPRRGARRAAARLAREVEERRRPADADHREDRGGRGPGRLPLRAPGGVPRRRDRRRPTCATTRTSRSRRRSSATSARSRPRS